jgi:drug/metabolite transporter (DMT)-like permease
MGAEANFLTSESSGWIASLGAAFAWSISVSIYRKWGFGRSVIWLNLFKGVLALACFSLALFFGKNESTPDFHAHVVLAISGVVGVLLGDSAFFAALPRVGATMTSAIQCLAPPLTGIFAWIFLQEQLSAGRVAGLVLTSFCLACLVYFESQGQKFTVRSDAKVFMTGIWLAIAAACCQAAGAVIARPALDGLSPFATGAARLWLPVLVLMIIQIRRAAGIKAAILGLSTGSDIRFLALASVLGTFLGLTLMMHGMAHAPLGVALALNSTYPVWIMLGERVFGRATISRRGAFFVIGSVAGIWLMI